MSSRTKGRFRSAGVLSHRRIVACVSVSVGIHSCPTPRHFRATVSNVHQHASTTKIRWGLKTPRIRDKDDMHDVRDKETRLCRNRVGYMKTIQQFDGEQAEKRVTRYVYHRVGESEHRCGLRRAEQHEGVYGMVRKEGWRETQLRNHGARGVSAIRGLVTYDTRDVASNPRIESGKSFRTVQSHGTD
ncbi:hypothetical protein H4582DRAFT_995242 [Lactarius indigo]|nr:hypothetical protein H4582DRAFT_995242 [Lactarius indigo]